MMHELGTYWSGSRSGFPLHKVCTSPAPGLRPGAKQRAQRVCNRRVNSSHLVSKVQRRVTSILGDRDSKDNQSQQETECLSSLAIVTGSSTLPQSMIAVTYRRQQWSRPQCRWDTALPSGSPHGYIMCEAPRALPNNTLDTKETTETVWAMLQKTAKTQTQFHQEVKCHTKRSFHPTNQAKCRACYVLSTYWLFPLPWDGKLQKQKPFGQKLQLMQHPNVTTWQKTLKSKLWHHVYIQNQKKCFKTSHLFTKSTKLHVDHWFKSCTITPLS